MAYVVPLWLLGLRAAPKLTLSNVRTVLPVALIHGCGQCVTVLSLGAGSLAFVNVVKALEPLFNVAFGALLMDDVLATGKMVGALIELIRKSGATLVGCGFLIDKAYEGGRDVLPKDAMIHSLV